MLSLFYSSGHTGPRPMTAARQGRRSVLGGDIVETFLSRGRHGKI